MSRALAWALVPLALAAAVAAVLLAFDPLRLGALSEGVPPVEELTVERTVLDGEGIALKVRADGTAPVRLVQVQVDGAYWTFAQEPAGPIERLDTVWLRIPYPWVHGEAHHLTLITSTGAAFDHSVEVAVATPRPTTGTFGLYGLVGLFVGVVPVALGMLFYPALRAAGGRGLTFALALTVGLLVFLLVDTFEEALELAHESAPGLGVPVLVWVAAALAFVALLAVGRRGGRSLSGVPLAAAIALGIGLHNLGEGLAIGAAFATGAAALGTFLVVGFTLHNVTEGIGIVAPLLDRRPGAATFAGLVALAGLPAVAGIWIGSYAFAPHWAALALAVGAGAILQVIVEVGALLLGRARSDGASWAPATAVAGVAVGLGAMYGTALLLPA